MFKNDLIKSLDFIIDKSFCYHTFPRAKREFDKIETLLEKEDAKKLKKALIWADPDNPDVYYHRNFECKYIADIVKEIKMKMSTQG